MSVDSFKITPIIAAIVYARVSSEAFINGTTARQEAEKILAKLAERISDVIKPFTRQGPDHPALGQGDVTWAYADLAAVVQKG